MPTDAQQESYIACAARVGITVMPTGDRWHVGEPDSVTPVICATRHVAARVAYALAQQFYPARA